MPIKTSEEEQKKKVEKSTLPNRNTSTAQSQPSDLDSNRSSFYISGGDDQMGHGPTQPRPIPVRQVQSVNGNNRDGANRRSFL